MDFEKKFREKYGSKEYEKIFSSDFKEAIVSIDKIAAIVSKGTKEDQER